MYFYSWRFLYGIYIQRCLHFSVNIGYNEVVEASWWDYKSVKKLTNQSTRVIVIMIQVLTSLYVVIMDTQVTVAK